MDIDTIKRVKGDCNLNNHIMKMNSQNSEQQQGTNKSYLQQDQSEKTQSLTILFNNTIDLNFKEIIALYDQIDQKLFDHKFSLPIIIAEKQNFENISDLKNQRIVLHSNENSLVLAGFLSQTHQLVVLKQMIFNSQETLIQKLDEYRIHQKINELFPQQSLQLIIPVRVIKSQNYYEIAACMERGQFNLYEYSRNHQISNEEAMNIFVQILDQIINLHSVNIAHRDIKPQNIFYVKEKGWLLSDFGESLQYEQVDGMYNIRGTKYFLITTLQQSISKNVQINQNLITNDTYALVVSMIMIKNQQHINDMKGYIDNLQDQLLKSAIKLSNLDELIKYRAKIKFNLNKGLINLHKQCNKQMDAEEKKLNDMCNIFSQMEYFHYLNNTNADPLIQQNIKLLLQKNLGLIQQKFNKYLGYMIINLSSLQNVNLKLRLNRNGFKRMLNKPPQQQQFYIELLFSYGYTEKTIQIAIEYLKTHYSQRVHLLLIDSYFRANMIQEAEKQLKLFNEGMVFDQIDTDSQEKYLQYLYHQHGEEFKYNVKLDFNFEKEFKDRGFLKSKQLMPEFLNEQNLLQNDTFLNRNNIVNSIVERLDLICSKFSPTTLSICHYIICYALNLPLFVLLPLLQQIYQKNYGQFDTNKKFIFLLEIAEIFILLNQRKEFMKYLKLMKKSIFYSESWEQTISFKIIYQTIHFMEYIYQQDNCKFNINLQLRRFVRELKKISKIKFNYYLQYILGSLVNLIKIIQIYEIYHKNTFLLQIIQFIINLAFDQNFHLSEFDNYQLAHIQAQSILIDLKNDKRSYQLVQKYKKFLNNKAIKVSKEKKMDPLNLLIRPSIKLLLNVQILNRQGIQSIVRNQFIKNRYFEQ